MITFDYDDNGAIVKARCTPQKLLAALNEYELRQLQTAARLALAELERQTPRYPRWHRSKCTNPNFCAARNAYRAEMVRIDAELRRRLEHVLPLMARAEVSLQVLEAQEVRAELAEA